jgi:hypothetical protein
MARLFRVVVVVVVLVASLLGSSAHATLIVDRNVKHPTLKVDQHGRALVQYVRANGTRVNALFWGAVNGIPNEKLAARQTTFQVDYTGGWGIGRPRLWKRIDDACRPYDGPSLPLFVAGCTAPDGSYWVLQEWVRLAPMRGLPPFKPSQTAVELHLSHWSGPLPELQVWPNWTYRARFQGFFGRLTYRGAPVFGSQPSGFGQYVYIDTHNSPYGPGWKHDAAKALHRPNGGFCYSFVPQYTPPDYPVHQLRGPGLGDRHRIRASGPGVTPIVEWEGSRLGAYDPVRDGQINAIFDRILGGDRVCAKER